MNDYQQFDALDFMQDPAFRDWVAGQSPGEDAFWEAWLVDHPEKTEVVQQAKEWLSTIWSEFDELPEHERTDRILQLKEARSERDNSLPTVRWLGSWNWWSAAAGVALVIGLGWLTYANLPTSTSAKPRRISYQQAVATIANVKPIEISTKAGQIRRVVLPDGSVITLSSQSRISYAPNLNKTKQRRVYLLGEAFFDIARNPDKPFLVYANGLVTKVLGTSFIVKAYENTPSVTVQVRSGRVSVFSSVQVGKAAALFNQLTNGIVLTPNQQVVLTPEEKLVKSIVPKPALLNPEKVSLGSVYTDAPLSQIFARLEASYGIDIVYDEAAFRECLLTARLYDEPLLDQISLICKSVDATYTVADARIVISGNGCQ